MSSNTTPKSLFALPRRQALGLAGAALLPKIASAQGRQKITVWTWGGV